LRHSNERHPAKTRQNSTKRIGLVFIESLFFLGAKIAKEKKKTLQILISRLNQKRLQHTTLWYFFLFLPPDNFVSFLHPIYAGQ
jgi:hypothetical protein